MNRFISYEGLPISSGGAHSVSRKSPKENYKRILDFLNLFADKVQPKSIGLTLYESENKEYSALKFLPELSFKFGVPKTRSRSHRTERNKSSKRERITNVVEVLSFTVHTNLNSLFCSF